MNFILNPLCTLHTHASLLASCRAHWPASGRAMAIPVIDTPNIIYLRIITLKGYVPCLPRLKIYILFGSNHGFKEFPPGEFSYRALLFAD